MVGVVALGRRLESACVGCGVVGSVRLGWGLVAVGGCRWDECEWRVVVRSGLVRWERRWCWDRAGKIFIFLQKKKYIK